MVDKTAFPNTIIKSIYYKNMYVILHLNTLTKLTWRLRITLMHPFFVWTGKAQQEDVPPGAAGQSGQGWRGAVWPSIRGAEFWRRATPAGGGGHCPQYRHQPAGGHEARQKFQPHARPGLTCSGNTQEGIRFNRRYSLQINTFKSAYIYFNVTK